MTILVSVPAKLAIACGLIPLLAALAANDDQGPTDDPRLHPPVRVMAGGVPIAVEEPGFAFPAWHDLTGDRRPDLVVAQFNGGKMMTFPRAEDGTFGEGRWLKAAGEVAEIPGVW